MPFIRYSRDKRGYETTVVLHAYRSVQGPQQRGRVLYIFRSPSNVKVGRRALDEEVMEALEHTHPDLTFDWSALQREMGIERPEYREREPRRESHGRPGQRTAPSAEVVAPVIEDQSPLGRALGASAAARLRSQYNDLLQRIVRRARTPEDRDRLTERATRLNPDEWPDEAAIRAAVQTIEADWGAISAELPQRRRGRRGGRNRRDGGPPNPSGIMQEQGEVNAEEHTRDVVGADLDSHDAGDSRGDGTGDGADATEAGPGADPDDPTRFHQDG